MDKPRVNTIFLDIGGVLLNNGWDRGLRKLAASTFELDFTEMDERHHLTFDTYEEGKITLDEYLERVIFYEQRSFSPQDFKEFMFAQSKPMPKMIDTMKELKSRYRLKIATVSNEGRELTIHRIQNFKLNEFVDFFISSCFVHFRKPDRDIYRVALDTAQTLPENVVYIDDRMMFVEVARSMEIKSFQHTAYESTLEHLEKYGLVL
ncbi:MAG: HAD family phosphatase [Chloroflexi bacterium]|nr:HAD family phosphatase [Chloroflexota bacterium]